MKKAQPSPNAVKPTGIGEAIRPCTCTHAAQDALYGRGLRAHNWARKAFNGQGGWRCTVCTKEKSI